MFGDLLFYWLTDIRSPAMKSAAGKLHRAAVKQALQLLYGATSNDCVTLLYSEPPQFPDYLIVYSFNIKNVCIRFTFSYFCGKNTDMCETETKHVFRLFDLIYIFLKYYHIHIF